jgi:cobalt-zinc-cadmium efflux system membrane fusion protein
LVEDVVMTVARFPGPRTILRAVACLAAALAGACSPRTTSEARGTVAAPDTSGVLVSTMTVDAPLELPAQLYVEHDASVVARSAGMVDSVLVDLGTRVTNGMALARLESADQALALAQAEATYENVSRLVNRARVMTKAGGVTVADSEQVEFQFAQAEIARRKARRDLELTRIVAPFSGVVTSRQARPGRFVAAGDTLFRVTEPGPLLARVRVPEGSAAGVRVGERATVVGVGGALARATVSNAATAFDAASGTREIVLRLAGDASFLPGASVTVRLGSRRREVVTVPRDAISAEGFALVMENGRSAMRPVTIGADIGDGRVEVVSGLASGERVVRTAAITR